VSSTAVSSTTAGISATSTTASSTSAVISAHAPISRARQPKLPRPTEWVETQHLSRVIQAWYAEEYSNEHGFTCDIGVFRWYDGDGTSDGTSDGTGAKCLVHHEKSVTFPNADNAAEYLFQLLRVHGARRPEFFTFSLTAIQNSSKTKQRYQSR
jgi:hypothetical protein